MVPNEMALSRVLGMDALCSGFERQLSRGLAPTLIDRAGFCAVGWASLLGAGAGGLSRFASGASSMQRGGLAFSLSGSHSRCGATSVIPRHIACRSSGTDCLASSLSSSLWLELHRIEL